MARRVRNAGNFFDTSLGNVRRPGNVGVSPTQGFLDRLAPTNLSPEPEPEPASPRGLTMFQRSRLGQWLASLNQPPVLGPGQWLASEGRPTGRPPIQLGGLRNLSQPTGPVAPNLQGRTPIQLRTGFAQGSGTPPLQPPGRQRRIRPPTFDFLLPGRGQGRNQISQRKTLV